MLILPIKRKWYLMILSGEKKEEYREVKRYYMARFSKIFPMYPCSNIPMESEPKEIAFRNGYSVKSPTITALCTLDIKQGREEWGAVPGECYYTLKIERITGEYPNGFNGMVK